MYSTVYVGVVSSLFILCLSVNGLSNTTSEYRASKSRLLADIKSHQDWMGLMNPSDDKDGRLIQLNFTFWPFVLAVVYLILSRTTVVRRRILSPNDGKILQLDEVTQSITTISAFFFIWWEHELSWNQSEYSNIDSIHLNIQYIWRPTILLANAADGDKLVLNFPLDKAMLFSTGMVILFTTSYLRTTCNFDLTSYPFDTQLCDILLVHDFEENQYNISFRFAQFPDMYNLTGEWSIVGREFEFFPYNMMFSKLQFIRSTIPRGLGKLPKLLIFLMIITAQSFFSIICNVFIMKRHEREQRKESRTEHGLNTCSCMKTKDDAVDAGALKDRSRVRHNQVAPLGEEYTDSRGSKPVDDLSEYGKHQPRSNNGGSRCSSRPCLTSGQWDIIFFTIHHFICIPLYIYFWFA
ncbi:hypothetical protein Btru_076175 [Bulinus truncatus]|nr:hypothetical protein Btru_076175 [Bulinus truncatus]